MLVPLDEGLLLWQLGDPIAETGSQPTGYVPDAQRWFSSAGWDPARQLCTPSASGTFTGASGTIPTLAWFEIDTKGCDILAISFSGKTLSSSGFATVSLSGIRAIAQGMFGYHPDLPARRKPFAARNDVTGYPASPQDMCHLSCFGGGGPDGSTGREDINQQGNMTLRALLHTNGAGAPANDYHAWQFSIGHRQGMPNIVSSASALATTLPVLSGIRRVWVAMVHVPTVTGAAFTHTFYGQLHAHRFYISPSSRA